MSLKRFELILGTCTEEQLSTTTQANNGLITLLSIGLWSVHISSRTKISLPSETKCKFSRFIGNEKVVYKIYVKK